MNHKIPFHELATMLAGNCNITPAEAEDFIKSFFEQLTRSLVEGETVKIKGIGIFSPSGDTDNPVTFTPDAEIADTVNAPFAMFEPEEVSDSLSDEAFDEVNAIESEPAHETETEITPEPETDMTSVEESGHTTEQQPAQEVVQEVLSKTESPLSTETPSEVETPIEVIAETAEEVEVKQEQPAPETVTVTETEAEPKSVPVQQTPIKPAPAPSYPDEEPEEYLKEPEQRSGAGFGWGFIIGILVGLAIGACGVYFAIDYFFPTMPESSVDIEAEENILSEAMLLDSVAAPLESSTDTTATTSTTAVTSAAATADTVTQAQSAPRPAAPAAQPVKDTIRPGYLLNDMAKKHYGNKCFWVYIYEENKAKIANPNRVGPGLVLVIPPAEKYGIDSSSQTSIKAANEKAGKILTKYPK